MPHDRSRKRQGAEWLLIPPRPGLGILVLGGGKNLTFRREVDTFYGPGTEQRLPGTPAGDDVTCFWRAMEDAVDCPVTFANGVAEILDVDFNEYALIVVCGDQFTTYYGGLTAAEHEAVVARGADLRDHVAAGGAVLGFASCFGSRRFTAPVQTTAGEYKVTIASTSGAFGWLTEILAAIAHATRQAAPLSVTSHFREDNGTILGNAWAQVPTSWVNDDSLGTPVGSTGDTQGVTVPSGNGLFPGPPGSVLTAVRSVTTAPAIRWQIKQTGGDRWRKAWAWYLYVHGYSGTSQGDRIIWRQARFAGGIKDFGAKHLAGSAPFFDPLDAGLKVALSSEGDPTLAEFFNHPSIMAANDPLAFSYQFVNDHLANPQDVQSFTASFLGPIFTPMIGFKEVTIAPAGVDWLGWTDGQLTLTSIGNQRWHQVFDTYPPSWEPLARAGADGIRSYNVPCAVAARGAIGGWGTVVLCGIAAEDGVFYDPAFDVVSSPVQSPLDPTETILVIPPSTFAAAQAGECGRQHGDFDAWVALVNGMLDECERNHVRVRRVGGRTRPWAASEGW